MIASNYTVANQAVEPISAKRSLFKDEAVLRFDTGSSTVATLQAVHLGHADLVIAPSQPGIGQVTLKLAVERPAALGLRDNAYDEIVVTTAHETGVPPQFMKGQIEQESNLRGFNPYNYRYEPCGADLKYISSTLGGAIGSPRIGLEPYKLYAAPNPRGSDLSDLDLEPRNEYVIFDGTRRRPLTNADINITARQIWVSNDVRGVRNGVPFGMNWRKWCSAAALLAIDSSYSIDVLGFVAQTPTASSYGLFQVMYDTAVTDADWSGMADPLRPGRRSRAPHYLFDTKDNWAIGGGSVVAGNAFLVLKYQKRVGLVQFSDFDRFRDAFRTAYRYYNGAASYGHSVIQRSESFQPVRSGSVLR